MQQEDPNQVKESDQSKAEEALDELMAYYKGNNNEFEYKIIEQEELNPQEFVMSMVISHDSQV